jgi:hypothetical protein
VGSFIILQFKNITNNEIFLKHKQIQGTFKQNMKQADIAESVRLNSFIEGRDINEFRDKNHILRHN